jgi:hypothetical protein
MATDWQELTRLTGNDRFTVERVRLIDRNVAIEGTFELPPLAGLSAEDQVFVMAFIHSHGSIKEMEKAFGVSYPTVKNRLNRISEQLPLVESEPTASRAEVLSQLRSGEITADEAVDQLAGK